MSKLYNDSNNKSSLDLTIYQNILNYFLSFSGFMPLVFLNFIPIVVSTLMQS